MEYAYLRMKSESGEKPVQLSSVPLTIGRHESNRLAINDSMASRFHCVVEKGAQGYMLRDLQSRNGTLLNGQRVISQALKTGDVIAIGAIQFTVVIHTVSKSLAGESARAAAPPPAKPAVALDELEVIDDLEVIEPGMQQGRAGTVAGADVRDDGADVDRVIAAVRKTADAIVERSFDVNGIVVFNLHGKTLHDWSAARFAPSEIVLLLHLTLLICFRSHATDIHLEPRQDDYLLRIRMDGNLLDIVAFSRDIGIKLSAVIKILCELDTTQRNMVQEGHFSTRAPNPPARDSASGSGAEGFRRVDYRVSFVPSLHGQKLVIRIFDTANAPVTIHDLHLPEAVRGYIGEELTKDTGLILVCGPTGSGKTTTLYSLLRSCGASFRNIVTIEDPVEVQIAGTTQMPVDEASGKSFAALLRSVLRQDPDVIMVGEIRDQETARIALQAAMTGHLVLSTIHTRDTVGTIFRLLDLGIEPYMVAQGLSLVLAQRLLRALCTSCRKVFAPMPEDRKRMGKYGEKIEKIYGPVGCPRCLGTGFYGRRALFEFLSANNELRDQILKNPSIIELQKSLGAEFMRLSDHGYQMVAEGVTSIDEVERVIGR